MGLLTWGPVAEFARIRQRRDDMKIPRQYVLEFNPKNATAK